MHRQKLHRWFGWGLSMIHEFVWYVKNRKLRRDKMIFSAKWPMTEHFFVYNLYMIFAHKKIPYIYKSQDNLLLSFWILFIVTMPMKYGGRRIYINSIACFRIPFKFNCSCICLTMYVICDMSLLIKYVYTNMFHTLIFRLTSVLYACW